MKLFKKKDALEELLLEEGELMEESEDTAPAKRKFKNKSKVKYGSYAIGITAIVIAVAVAVNVLFGVLAKRVNLDIDISLKGDNTLTEENIEFLKTVDVPVKLTVCSSKDTYLDLDYYTGQSFGVSESGVQYYEQTLRFLEMYPKYSDNITVEFIDLQKPESAEVIRDYANHGLNYGDIIVSATHVVDGKETVRDTVVAYDDIYYLSDPYSQYYGYSTGSYVVSGNYFERAVSSAIRNVASKETYKVGVIATHCQPTAVTYYTETLKLNGYEIETISDTIISEIDSKYSLLLMASPTEDFAVSELEAIDTWLYNNGLRGRGLIFFASPTTPEVPLLYSYLEEWGIAVGEGILFDTNDDSHVASDPMTMLYMAADAKDNKIIESMTKEAQGFLVGSAVPLTAIIEDDGTRSTHVPVTTYSDSVAVAPYGSSSSWTPSSDDELDTLPGVIVARDEEYVDNVPKASYIVAFASTSFVNQSIIEMYPSVNNLQLALNAANLSVSADEETFSFYMKSIEAETYVVTEGAAKAIKYVFQWGVPVLLIALGIVVFIRRRRR